MKITKNDLRRIISYRNFASGMCLIYYDDRYRIDIVATVDGVYATSPYKDGESSGEEGLVLGTLYGKLKPGCLFPEPSEKHHKPLDVGAMTNKAWKFYKEKKLINSRIWELCFSLL